MKTTFQAIASLRNSVVGRGWRAAYSFTSASIGIILKFSVHLSRALTNPGRLYRAIKRRIFLTFRFLGNPAYLLGRLFRGFYLRKLWQKQIPARAHKPPKEKKFTFLDLDIVYINLDMRRDRQQHIESQLKAARIHNYQRFSAIADSNGALGCSKSHLSILEKYQSSNKPLLVLEDDIEFLLPNTAILEYINEFMNDPRLDVLCLGNNIPDLKSILNISDKFSISNDIQTTSCYLAKPHVIQKMAKIAKKSVKGLELTKSPEVFAIDVVWKIMQSKEIFVIPNVRCVRQIDSYSDIEKRFVSYKV
jgi:hypothetical protein